MKRALIIAALLLAGCDRAADVGKTRPSTPEEEAALERIPSTDALGQPAPTFAAPYNLPAYTPLYPGAVIDNSNATAASGGPGGLVSFTAPASVETVAAFYRGQAIGREVSEAEASGTRMIAVSAGAAERAEIHIAPSENGARVVIAYVLPGG
ncbi:MAG: hypothetical protein AB7J28_07090 [Hyphomonadaceae bacterium]